jgi:hypothetical protein
MSAYKNGKIVRIVVYKYKVTNSNVTVEIRTKNINVYTLGSTSCI